MPFLRLLSGVAAAGVVVLLAPPARLPVAPLDDLPPTRLTTPPPSAAVTVPSGHDFDFLAGTWNVTNRRLKARFVGSTDWDVFPGRSVARSVLSGVGNVDEITLPTKGVRGVTVSLFDREAKAWMLYWVTEKDGILGPPVRGGFRDGLGEFFGDDVDDGRPVKVRYRWSGITANAARWEQAFSRDGGATWETNWIMEFRRATS